MLLPDRIRLSLVVVSLSGCAGGVAGFEPGGVDGADGAGGAATVPMNQGGGEPARVDGTGGGVVDPLPTVDGSTFGPPSSEPPLVSLSFTSSTDDFLNPERGFHADLPLPAESVDDVRSRGLSVMRSYVVLD